MPTYPMKQRSPWGVWLLAIVTLGIYFYVWYYKIHRELLDRFPHHAINALIAADRQRSSADSTATIALVFPGTEPGGTATMDGHAGGDFNSSIELTVPIG